MQKTLEEFRQEILTERGIKSSGSIPHGISQEIMEIAAERYASNRVKIALALILKAISDTQYLETNNIGEVGYNYITDMDTINAIDFKYLLTTP